MSSDRIELLESRWPVACGGRRLACLGALLLAGLLPAMTAEAQSSPDIFEATLAQPDQKTAEVSTEELRRIQIEPAGFQYVSAGDDTAVVFDARSAEAFKAGTLEGARHLPKEEVTEAKDDGRLPMEDHNTRIIAFADSAAEARAAAEEIAKNAFHNVAFCEDLFCGVQIAQK